MAREIVENKRDRLVDIMNSDWTMALTPERRAACFRRQGNAKRFLDELEEVFQILYLDAKFRFVPLKKFYAFLQKAEDITDFFDGDYCKIANLHSFGEGSVWVIYLKADRDL